MKMGRNAECRIKVDVYSMKYTPFIFHYRVSYADTDQMHVVYYAHYFVWFERARTELLRSMGFAYKDIEERGYCLPVAEASCAYHGSARYDDEIDIVTKIFAVGHASVSFTYEVKRGDTLLATGHTKHPFVAINGKPTKWLPELKQALQAREETLNPKQF